MILLLLVQSNEGYFQVLTGVFSGIALIVVILRLLTRMHPFKATFGWDDFLIMFAMACLIIVSSVQYLGKRLNMLSKFCKLIFQSETAHGFGRDIWTIPPDNISLILKVGA